MSIHPEGEEEWDTDHLDTEDEYEDHDEDDGTSPCPYCNKPVYEDSSRCPYCERYISSEDEQPNRTPRWIIVCAILCLIATLLAFVG